MPGREGGASNDIMDTNLWNAANSGDANFFEEVVQNDKALLLPLTIDGDSALHIAAKLGFEEIARQVSEAQPSLLTQRNYSGDTPLHLASAAGHLGIVNLFIHQHERLRQHHRSSSCCHVSVRKGLQSATSKIVLLCINILNKLLRLYLRPSSGGVEEDGMSMDNEIGNTDICAATIGSLPSTAPEFLLKQLIRELHQLSFGGVEEDGMLMDNKIGNTALHAATIGGHLSVVNLLLSAAPKLVTMTNQAGVSALYMAAERNLLQIVEKILAVSAEEVSHKGPRGQTALHAAVLRSYEISMMILDKNPSCLKHQDASKSTPLHFAAANGDVAILGLLLQENATAGYMQDEMLDDGGFAIIHIAASVGDLNMIKEILVYCPDALKQKNRKGRNFVHVAVEMNLTKDKSKNLNVVEYVLNSSPSAKELLNEQDHDGNTPLHLAVLAEDREMVQLLISSQIGDTALTNNSGFNPIDLAFSKDKIEVSLPMSNIRTYLKSHGLRFSPRRVDHIIRNDARRKQDEEIKKKKMERKEDINQCRVLANNLSVIAVLIATVSFAAAFTLPGGTTAILDQIKGWPFYRAKLLSRHS